MSIYRAAIEEPVDPNFVDVDELAAGPNNNNSARNPKVKDPRLRRPAQVVGLPPNVRSAPIAGPGNIPASPPNIPVSPPLMDRSDSIARPINIPASPPPSIPVGPLSIVRFAAIAGPRNIPTSPLPDIPMGPPPIFRSVQIAVPGNIPAASGSHRAMTYEERLAMEAYNLLFPEAGPAPSVP
jgi:hypothetical protein